MKDILTQKAYKDYTYISRYSVFPYYYNRMDEKYIYGLTSQLKKDTNFVSYKVKRVIQQIVYHYISMVHLYITGVFYLLIILMTLMRSFPKVKYYEYLPLLISNLT